MNIIWYSGYVKCPSKMLNINLVNYNFCRRSRWNLLNNVMQHSVYLQLDLFAGCDNELHFLKNIFHFICPFVGFTTSYHYWLWSFAYFLPAVIFVRAWLEIIHLNPNEFQWVSPNKIHSHLEHNIFTSLLHLL